ncbi:hypothetical protein CONPUDRAFT_115821 [Coniophora puteana RWD-64-598 SS2]|uniref:CSC1/OSCA1-like 7TM region domain-containing protein n=1 Tax=Coniophora puteana (strain RWD-64-598) TaxID=741705 RepID=A0A5M3N690_CONPW|nr:uncharacterized protein CONPUDRAFT_115821 [Coniophora puteana RWD-64-598 SS2]EIW86933.1 hypothetical protein CONPUDRAFT_115821 [Coniophora puteana RWD-64-598 SS2]
MATTLSHSAHKSRFNISTHLAQSLVAPIFHHEYSLNVRDATQVNPVCIGSGLDAGSYGIIATIVAPGIVGLAIWITFAIVRPRYRQVYALREWFVPQDVRPNRLESNAGAFLTPNTPMRPSIQEDVSNAGQSMAEDAQLFPSDEELSQRTLWTSFLVVLSWSLAGLAGAIPLYTVNIPCLAQSNGPALYTGVFSVLQDLSLLRLLRSIDNLQLASQSYLALAHLNPAESMSIPHTRIIVLACLAVVATMLPALYLTLKEFRVIVALRKRWLDIRCGGRDMGWLSADNAPGLAGMGEQSLKEYLVKLGLRSVGRPNRRNGRHASSLSHSHWNSSQSSSSADGVVEVDVQGLFSICDTQNLAVLIEQRDEILENLEVAETKYISSFRLSTPDPSIADLEVRIPPPTKSNKPYISHPLPLGGTNRTRRSRKTNPAHATSSFAPTAFVAPSQYYKIRGMRSITSLGNTPNDSGHLSFSDSFQQRIVGSRFQEVNRDSVDYDRLPLGSQLILEKSGELGPVPDPRFYGPNHPTEPSGSETLVEGSTHRPYTETSQGGGATAPRIPTVMEGEEGWTDLMRDVDLDGFMGRDTVRLVETPDQLPPARPRPPRIVNTPSTDRRETFPLRNKAETNAVAEVVPPPHLRLQPRQPFVRPASGLDYDDLGSVYAEINQWRSKLKSINSEIVDAQHDCYTDIAEGTHVKGWILIGRGLKHIHGVELIEGRAREDIRWDVLQTGTHILDSVGLGIVIFSTTMYLLLAITAVTGLSLSTAPNFAHYLEFLQPLSNRNDLASGIATMLASAIAATLFAVLVFLVVRRVAFWSPHVSISAVQLLSLKIIYYLFFLVVAGVIVIGGAVLYSIEAISQHRGVTKSLADGSIYMAMFALAYILTASFTIPGLLLLRPVRLWKVLRAEKTAITPRQRFRAVYPGSSDTANGLGACVLAIIFASAFSLIFPLIGPSVVLLLFLTLVAHRFLIGYVYCRTLPSTGGLAHIWLLKRLATLCTLQPLLLGLILLTRHFWLEGGILVGIALIAAILVETYCTRATSQPRSLNPNTCDALQTLSHASKQCPDSATEDETSGLGSPSRGYRARGSMASVLEMMSLTLAVVPSESRQRGILPLQTETLDDLTATERAARTHPDAPPHLPPLSFAVHSEETAGVLYAPELIAPCPVIWLPHDSAGVARSEADDLEKYHDLRVTLDVQASQDVLPSRNISRAQ